MAIALGDVHPLTARDFDDTRKFVDTSFGRIAYVERGHGPVALFVHGAILNGYQWRHQLAGLAELRRVIALDTLGMGHTELAPGQPLGLAQQAAMFKAFLDALAITEVDIVGNDSGGGAVQVFAANHPSYIRSMALTNCEVHDYDEHAPAFVSFRNGLESGALLKMMQAAVADPAVGRKAFANAYQRVADLPDDAFAAYLAPLIASPERIAQLRAYVAATTNRDLIEIAPRLRALQAPTLVLWGTSDEFFPVARAYWLRDNLPNVVEVVEVEGGRVFWPEEQPQLLNSKLRALWTRAR
jgi:pimeloyl-ACP methyl ester carboxylesterase